MQYYWMMYIIKMAKYKFQKELSINFFKHRLNFAFDSRRFQIRLTLKGLYLIINPVLLHLVI